MPAPVTANPYVVRAWSNRNHLDLNRRWRLCYYDPSRGIRFHRTSARNDCRAGGQSRKFRLVRLHKTPFGATRTLQKSATQS